MKRPENTALKKANKEIWKTENDNRAASLKGVQDIDAVYEKGYDKQIRIRNGIYGIKKGLSANKLRKFNITQNRLTRTSYKKFMKDSDR